MFLKENESLEILLAAGMTTSHCPLVACYLDMLVNLSGGTPDGSDTVTNGTTPVAWVSAPATGYVRQVKYLSLRNDDTVTHTFTVRKNNGSTTRKEITFILLTGERVEFVETSGWRAFGANGTPKSGIATLADADYGDIVVTGNGTVLSLDTAAGTGKHSVYIAAGSMSPSASGGCAALATIASAASQPDIQTLDFDTTTQEYCQFGMKMPSSWNEGTITFRPVWSHPSTTTNFGVVWDCQAVAVSDDDAIAVAFGTAQTSTDTGGTTNDVYIGPESSAITVSGSPAAGDMVFFRISRVTGNGSDTMAVDARLHGVEILMTTNERTDS